MENRLKLRISRILCSSFCSCRPRNLSDVVEEAALSVPRYTHTAPLLRPGSADRPLPSLCCPACPDPSGSTNPSCIVSAKSDASQIPWRSRRRPPLSEHCHYYSPLAPVSGRLCPASRPFYRAAPNKSKTRKKKGRGKQKGKDHQHNQRRRLFISTSSQDTNTSNGWFSSDDEREEDVGDDRGKGDETDTLFSSINLSDDGSSAARRRHRRTRRRTGRKVSGFRRETAVDLVESVICSNIKGSFAVVKRSSDPYGDFMASMVDMIVERHLLGALELEQLLRCYLALNSSRYHAVIVAVFTEIWETLFSSPPPAC